MEFIAGIGWALLISALLAPTLADARGYASHNSRSRSSGYSSSHSYPHSHSSGSKAVPGVHRDSHRQMARSSTARRQFVHSRPCLSTGKSSGACPGYVIDHVMPLQRGGADNPCTPLQGDDGAGRFIGASCASQIRPIGTMPVHGCTSFFESTSAHPRPERSNVTSSLRNLRRARPSQQPHELPHFLRRQSFQIVQEIEGAP